MKIFVINGPNLNMLGLREPHIYGSTTLDDIKANLNSYANDFGCSIDFYQSNSESEIIEHIQEIFKTENKNSDIKLGVVINPGALTHTSVALYDALKMLKSPIIEVHISNIFARESFRHHSYISPIAKAVITGAGIKGYNYAIDFLANNYK